MIVSRDFDYLHGEFKACMGGGGRLAALLYKTEISLLNIFTIHLPLFMVMLTLLMSV